jgi:hypothetical protein
MNSLNLWFDGALYDFKLLFQSSADKNFIAIVIVSVVILVAITKELMNNLHTNSIKLIITKRETIMSIAIIAIMMTIGLVVYNCLSDDLMLRHQDYNLSLSVENDENMFKYAMSTDVGEAFVYGDFECIDPVSFDEIGGEYSYIRKVKKEKDSEGDWCTVDVLEKQCNNVMFLGKAFKYEEMNFFCSASKIKTIEKSYDEKYVYYGIPAQGSGTLHADLKNDTIEDATFYLNYTIDESIELLESNWQSTLFWIWWILIVCFVVFVFVYIDNRWLEDN